jgi:hypothetical protein
MAVPDKSDPKRRWVRLENPYPVAPINPATATERAKQLFLLVLRFG